MDRREEWNYSSHIGNHNEFLFYQDASVAALTELAQTAFLGQKDPSQFIVDTAELFMSKIALKHMLHSSNQLPPVTEDPPPVPIDCTNPAYAHVLTGKPVANPKHIIDIVPFGFDIDMLEIRLLEYYEYVDFFLISEQDRALRGFPKGYWLTHFLNTSRFARFQGKIVYTQYEIPQHLIPADPSKRMFWGIERTAMRKTPSDYLKAHFFHNISEEEQEDYYVTANDLDEVTSRSVMAHFRHCEHQPNIEFPLEAPGQVYKRNTLWMERTKDMDKLQLSPTQQPFAELKGYMWLPGPSLWRWKDYAPKPNPRSAWRPPVRHFGLGAGRHFSSPGHPILGYIKGLSTVDCAPLKGRFPLEFWNRAKAGQLVFKNDLTKDIVIDFCDKVQRHNYVNIHTVLQNKTQEFLFSTLPWAVTNIQPYRYPFLYHPGLAQEEAAFFEKHCGFAVNGEPIQETKG